MDKEPCTLFPQFVAWDRDCSTLYLSVSLYILDYNKCGGRTAQCGLYVCLIRS